MLFHKKKKTRDDELEGEKRIALCILY